MTTIDIARHYLEALGAPVERVHGRGLDGPWESLLVTYGRTPADHTGLRIWSDDPDTTISVGITTGWGIVGERVTLDSVSRDLIGAVVDAMLTTVMRRVDGA